MTTLAAVAGKLLLPRFVIATLGVVRIPKPDIGVNNPNCVPLLIETT